MSRTMEDVKREAGQLPRDQRLALARFLIELDEPSVDTGVEAAWDAEILERVRAVDEGRAEVVLYDQVLTQVNRRLKR